MEILVYPSEKFERSIRRYFAFGLIFAIILFLSIFIGNIVGAIVLLFLLGAYFFFTAKNSRKVPLTATDSGLQLDTTLIPRSALQAFIVEFHPQSHEPHNLVLFTAQNERILTLADELPKTKKFLDFLGTQLPLREKFDQSTFQILLRILKL